jgi:hypothetical protein
MTIITTGFTFTIPSSTMDILTNLSSTIGIFPYETLSSPIFNKDEPRIPTVILTKFDNDCNADAVYSSKKSNTVGNKCRNGRGMKSNNQRQPFGRYGHRDKTAYSKPNVNEKFSQLRTKFVATKFEKKSELKTQMDEIRTMLNKLTRKNYLDMIPSIIKSLDKMQESCDNSLEKVGNMIFEIASSNRFYSNTYAELYSELIEYNPIFRVIFMNSFDTFIDLFRDVKCVDSTIDYNEFCENEKRNERRRSLGEFFINLMKNGIIEESNVLQVMQILSIQLRDFYLSSDKKPEVDELIETLAIMYDKTWLDLCKSSGEYCIEVNSCNMTIIEFVYFLSKCKRVDFPGLTSKSIFKCMDLVSS